MAVHFRSIAKRTWVSILRISAACLLFSAILIGLMLGTEGGRIALTKQGLQAWKLWSRQDIVFEDIRSPGIGQWRIGQIHLKGLAQAPDIEINDVLVDWNWVYALRNRWWFSELKSSSVNVMLEPQEAAPSSSGDALGTLYRLWPKIPELRIESIQVDEVSIQRPSLPTFTSEITGQVDINWGSLPARLLLALNDTKTPNTIAVQVSAESVDIIRLKGRMFAEEDSVWAQWLNWTLNGPAEADWDVLIDYSVLGQLKMSIEEGSIPWQSHLLKAKGDVEYDVNQKKLSFLPLTFTLDDQPASLEGWIAKEESALKVEISNWVFAPFSGIANVNDLDGRLSLDAVWLGGWRRPLLDASLSSSGAWRDYPFELQMTSSSEASLLTIETAELTLSDNQFDVSGHLDWSTDELDLGFKGTLNSNQFLIDFLPTFLSDLRVQTALTGTVTGSVTSPKVSTQTAVSGLWQEERLKGNIFGVWEEGQFNVESFDIDSSILTAKGTADYDATNQQWSTAIRVEKLNANIIERIGIKFPIEYRGFASGDITIQGGQTPFELSGPVRVDGFWQEWPVQADVTIQSLSPSHIQFDAPGLQLGESIIDAEGLVDWSEKALDLNFKHQQWPLAMLPPWFSFWPDLLQSFDGLLTGRTQVVGPWTRPAIATDTNFIGQWFAEPLTLTLVTQPKTNTDWIIRQLDGDWLGGQWHYSGAFEPYRLGINGEATIDNLHSNWVGLLSREFIGREKNLPKSMDVLFDGDLNLGGQLTSPTLSGNVSANGQLSGTLVEVSADIAYLDTNHVEIRQAEGIWADGSWSVKGDYNWTNEQVAMTIATQTPDANHLVPWLRLALNNNQNFEWIDQWQGSLMGNLTIDNRSEDWLINGDVLSSGVLLAQPYQLSWQGSGRFNQALNQVFSGEWGQGRIDATLVSSLDEVKGKADVQSMSYDQIRPFSSLVPDSMSGKIDAQLELSGRWAQPYVSAFIDTSGVFGAHSFNASLNFHGDRQDWELERSLIEIPGGISLAMDGRGKNLEGSVSFDGLLPDTNYWVSNSEVGAGEGGFNLTASGNLLSPQLFGDFDWRSKKWPLSFNLNLKTEDESYLLETLLVSEGQTVLTSMLSSNIGSLQQWLTEFEQKDLRFDVTLDTPLTVLDPLFIDHPNQGLSGNIRGDATLEGSLLNPRWNGSFQWQNGAYEHASFGTIIDDIALNITADNRQWLIVGSGKDGDKGKVALNGNVLFAKSTDQPLAHQLNLGVNFDKAKLLNQAQMDAGVTGKLRVLGSYHDMKVSGLLDVFPLNIQSDTFLWDGAPQLNIVTSVNDSNFTPDQLPFYWPQGTWDVRLISDTRATLYGQGINALLSGELELTDDFYQPRLAGHFEIVRGSYYGLGKAFDLTSGTVQLQNDQIVLDITGEYSNPELSVTIRISGTQDELNLTLSSDTGQGQDELLAQLLFGKNVEEMSVIQAIQLANVVNKLRTGDSGLDIISTTREDLSLDTLVVDTGTDEEGNLAFNVSAGKYINDFLYLEVEQGVGSNQEFRGSVQYRLAPRTYVELYTQGENGEYGKNGIELKWSFDY